MMKIVKYLLILLLLSTTPAWAADYYVRPLAGEYGAEDGSSYAAAYDGFSDIVWADVDSGNGKLFVAGTHNEKMTITVSGESGAPIHVVSCTIANGASDADPGIIDGLDTVDDGISWTNLSYITLEDLEIKNVTDDAIFHGTNSGVTAEYIIIDSCHMHHNGDQGYYGNASYGTTLQYVTLTNCVTNDNGGYGYLLMAAENSTISECSSTDDSLDPTEREWGIGIVGIWTDGGSWSNVSGNIYRVAESDTVQATLQRTGEGRWLTEEAGTCSTDTDPGEWCQSGGYLYVNLGAAYGDPSDNGMRWIRKWATDNTITKCSATGTRQWAGKEGTGIGLDSATKDSVIEYCYSYSNEGNGFSTNYTQNNTVRYNISANNGIGNAARDGMIIYGPNGGYVYGNTIYGAADDGLYIVWGTSIAKNNIIFDCGGYGIYKDAGAGTTLTHSNNLSYSNTSGNWQGISKGGTDLEEDPLLTDVIGSDFTLQPTSPCIDVGADLGDTYDDGLDPASTWPNSVATLDQDDAGASWEIGAYVLDLYISSALPIDDATNVSIEIEPSWANPTGENTNDGYFKTGACPTAGGDSVWSNQAHKTSYDPGTLAEATTHCWRVDIDHDGGTETGIDREFTTSGVPPPPVSGLIIVDDPKGCVIVDDPLGLGT